MNDFSRSLNSKCQLGPELRSSESPASASLLWLSLSHQPLFLTLALTTMGRAATSVPGTRRNLLKPGQDWRHEAQVVVVLGQLVGSMRLERVFTKFGLAVKGLNFYYYLQIEIFSQDIQRAFSGSVKVTLTFPSVSPLTQHTSFVCNVYGGEGVG